MRRHPPFWLLATVAIAATATPLARPAMRSTPTPNLSALSRCLAANGVRTKTIQETLAFPATLPAASAIDRALRLCRRFTFWPKHYGSAKLVHDFRERGLRFRACMKAHGRDPGAPTIIVTLRGIGATFARAIPNAPAVCEQILFRR